LDQNARRSGINTGNGPPAGAEAEGAVMSETPTVYESAPVEAWKEVRIVYSSAELPPLPADRFPVVERRETDAE
jgi:hypothetical protein